MKKLRLVAAAVGAALILAGCTAAPSHEPGSAYQLEALPSNVDEAHFSFVRGFSSIDEIIDAADAVVVARLVSKQGVDESAGAPTMTDATMKVEQVLAGELQPGGELVVHYTGGPDDPVTGPVTPSLPSHPKEGLQYLMAITKFQTGDLVVTGPGQWVREFDDQRFALDVHEYDMLTLDHTVPLDLTVDELRKAIAD